MIKITEKPDSLIIEVPKFAKPTPSSTGKMLLMASTGGFQATTHTHDGKPVKVSLIVGFNPAV